MVHPPGANEVWLTEGAPQTVTGSGITDLLSSVITETVKVCASFATGSDPLGSDPASNNAPSFYRPALADRRVKERYWNIKVYLNGALYSIISFVQKILEVDSGKYKNPLDPVTDTR